MTTYYHITEVFLQEAGYNNYVQVDSAKEVTHLDWFTKTYPLSSEDEDHTGEDCYTISRVSYDSDDFNVTIYRYISE